MGEQLPHSVKPNGNLYDNRNNTSQSKTNPNEINKNRKGKDDDLIIEENTVYEIDRECYERLKKQKKR